MAKEENNLYAKWLSGNLNSEEERSIKDSGDEAILEKIRQTVDKWSLPEMSAGTFTDLKKRIEEKQSPKVIPLHRRPKFLAIAASTIIVLFLCVWLLQFNEKGPLTTIACNAGQTNTLILSDCTIVTLSGKSKLIFEADGFTDKREVMLEGEGFFSVRQKGHFKVNFTNGNVNVLGTQFNVLTTEKAIAIKCYEGKVEVTLGKKNYRLTKDQGVRKINNLKAEVYSFSDTIKNTSAKEVYFNETPLAEVCASLSLFYDLSFTTGDVDMSRSFTGIYDKQDADKALLIVFDPMSVSFFKNGNRVTLKNK